MKTTALLVKWMETGEVVHRVEIREEQQTNERHVDRTERGLLLNMDRDSYCVDREEVAS